MNIGLSKRAVVFKYWKKAFKDALVVWSHTMEGNLNRSLLILFPAARNSMYKIRDSWKLGEKA